MFINKRALKSIPIPPPLILFSSLAVFIWLINWKICGPSKHFAKIYLFLSLF